MLFRFLIISINVFFLSFPGQAQYKYWVFFSDKDGSSFDPFDYFDQKAIDRRIKVEHDLYDYSDLPVKDEYLSKIIEKVDSIGFVTRWFNGVSVYCNPQTCKEIKGFSFVRDIEIMRGETQICGNRNTRLSKGEILLLEAQTERFEGSLLSEKGLTGKGMRIAILDTGFPNVNKSPVFNHIRQDNRIVGTYDFIAKSTYVYRGYEHGTIVMSCIGGISEFGRIGLATGAEFLLARTESHSFEFQNEEDRWVAAMEWADREGADIINSSLGYTDKRYFPEEMDGRKSLVSRAGNLAAKKGILVVNAAGNDGLDNWRVISAPADADSVLAVGGINPWTGYHSSFSSYGPTADKRLKPNLCGYGHVMAEGKKGLHETQGTSFASPLVAGFAACVWGNDKDLSNMDLYMELEKSSDLYPYFDYAHGYGVPRASYFLSKKKAPAQTFDVEVKEGVMKIVIRDEYFQKSIDSTDIEEDDKGEYKKLDEALQGKEESVGSYDFYYPQFEGTNDLFYGPDKYKSFIHWPGHALIHVENEEGVLDNYYVIAIYQKEILRLNDLENLKGKTIRVFYLGYTQEIKF